MRPQKQFDEWHERLHEPGQVDHKNALHRFRVILAHHCYEEFGDIQIHIGQTGARHVHHNCEAFVTGDLIQSFQGFNNDVLKRVEFN